MTIKADNIWMGLLMLVGGLGLFLYGMILMGEGLQLAAGERLRRMLETLTRGRVRGVLTGAGVTALIQSSSATTVMLVGFVNAGLMTFTQSVAVIFGANIGTTVTAQIVAFNVKTLAFPCIGAGLLLYMVGSKKSVKYSGEVLLGFGVLFLGMAMMTGAMSPLAKSQTFENWIGSYGSNWFIGFLLGILITSILQSSSATTSMVIAMAVSGVLTLGVPEGVDPAYHAVRIAFPIILGCNIGTCITAFIASLGTSLPAQRVAVAHYLFNITGAMLFLPFTAWMPHLTRWVAGAFGAGPEDVARQIAFSHTIFNTVMTLLWLPFIGQFVKVVKWIRKGDEKMPQRDPLFLDPRIFHSPAVALEMARKEIARMARLTLEMLSRSMGFLWKMDRAGKRALLEEESIVDGLAHNITEYLSKLSQEPLSDEQSELLTGMMHAVNDIERIGDHAENIMYLAENKNDGSFRFTEEGEAELNEIRQAVMRMYEGMIEAFEEEDVDKARRFKPLEGEIDDMASRFRRNHLGRLNRGECDGQAGVIFLDTLSNLERVGDLANNLGHVVAGELDQL